MKTAVVTEGRISRQPPDRPPSGGGFRVVGVDNFITGNPANLDHLKNNRITAFKSRM